MSYTKAGNWQNDITPPAINAANLSNIELGIYAHHSEPTLANLRALPIASLTNNMVRQVLGSSSVGDGGGGVYRFNIARTTPDDGSAVIAPIDAGGSGRWERLAHAESHASGGADALSPSVIGALGTSGGSLSGALTLAADPTNALHAATKQYVDAARSGLDVKQSVKVATTANITLSGTQTIDGVAVIAGDRVLVKNQTTGSENGIYDVASGAWSRSADADTSAEVTAGMFTFVEQGTANHDAGYVLSTDNPITLGTTALTFTIFSSSASAAGVGAISGVSPNSPGGNINLTAGSNVTITPNDATDTITIAASGGGAATTLVAVDSISALKAITVSSFGGGEMRQVNGYYAFGDGGGGVFRYNQASIATDDGGTVIAPTVGSGRWERVYSGPLDVRWFGAKGDGTTDDTTAINNALAVFPARGGVLFFPAGQYKITSTINISKPITIQGAGFSADPNNVNNASWNPATEFKWVNAVGATMFTTTPVIGGVQFRDFGMDGNGQATKGFYLERLMNSSMQNIGIRNLASSGIGLHGTSANNTAADQNFQANRITSFYCFADEGIRLDGTSTANSCHNLFQKLILLYGNATTNTNALTLGNCDNNTFTDVFTFRNAGTGYGIEFQSLARANYVFHVQGSVMARTPTTPGAGNLIIGFDRENGQSQPTLESGASLQWTESGSNNAGWNFPGVQNSFGVGTNSPSPSQTGIVAHVVSNSSAITPEVKIENTASNTAADLRMYGKTSGGTVVAGRMLSSPFNFACGSISSHDFFLTANNQSRVGVMTAGGTNFYDTSGNLVFGVANSGHVVSGGTSPTIAAGTGAGTSPTVITVTGKDLAGRISVTTGTGTPAASATVVTVTFGSAFGAAPYVILTPANVNAAARSGVSDVYVDRASVSTTVFVLKSGTTGLAASTAYEWFYQVIQ